MKLASGTRFGNLQIESELGRGTSGTVYRALDTVVGRVVVLKVLPRTDDDGGNRTGGGALREARLLGGLRSAHIVALYQVHAIDDGHWGLEMEYVDGGTLEAVLETRGRLSHAEAADVLRGVLRALEAAHEHGILHRDVKPGNVLLGEDRAVKLTDFELGGRPGKSARRSSGRSSGTPLYMAPETLGGEEACVASDLWSVGVLAYRMLAGRPPFGGRDRGEVLEAVRAARPAALGTRVPRRLAGWVGGCLARDPSRRPSSAREALAGLEAACRAAPWAAGARRDGGGRKTVSRVVSGLLRATAAEREGRGDEARRLARAAQAAATRLGRGWLLETAEAARLARRTRAS